MRFRYLLIDAIDGRKLGWFTSHRDDWKPGEFIGSENGPRRIIMAVVEPENDVDFRAYLVVVSAEVGTDAEAAASYLA